MAHDHTHHTNSSIASAFFLNLAFTIIEVIGGLYTNSVAILSDALHDFGDSISLGLAWGLEKYSKKKRDQRYTYGYGRFSLLSAFLNGLVLIIGSVFILIETIPRLINPVQPDAQGMIVLSVLGIIFNGLAVLKMRHGNTQNEKVVMWHLFEDVLGWIAVLVASIVMYFYNIPILDPIISAAFTLFILYNVAKNFMNTSRIFLQAKPEHINLESLEVKLLDINMVQEIYDLHLWTMDGERSVLTVHARLKADTTVMKMMDIKKTIRNQCREAGVDHMTIELTFENEPIDFEDCIIIDKP